MFEITKALPCDAEEITAIYDGLKGFPGCTWDEEYPTLEFVKNDIESRNSLYKVTDGDKIAAAAYLGEFEETERPDYFDKSIRRLGELSRVGVRREYHRKGVAFMLVTHLIGEAEKLGYDGIALLVGTENHAAMGLYEKACFKRCGETFLYETHWFCYQYKLKGQ